MGPIWAQYGPADRAILMDCMVSQVSYTVTRPNGILHAVGSKTQLEIGVPALQSWLWTFEVSRRVPPTLHVCDSAVGCRALASAE